ncbi:hypothetical protein J7L60_01365 [Candidatus Bathyarchaeota archaeon]|nr:hypothetical protein [Candidatus Bathyarchaeota archaeon]
MVTTLIILVVSVLLAGVVTYYATNITMTRTEQEDVVIQYAHVWVNSTGTAEAAFYLKNVGGRDILIDKITIRGVEAEWSSVYYNTSSRDSDLVWISHEDLGNSTVSGLSAASDDLPVESGGTRIIYIKNPDNIALADVGTTVTITVFTAEGQWIVEVNVEYAGS